QAVRFEFGPAELADGGFVAAGQLIKGEAAVLVEVKKLVAFFCRRQQLFRRTKRIVDVQQQDGTVGVKKRANLLGKRFDGTVDDRAVGVLPQGQHQGRRQRNGQDEREREPQSGGH